MAVKQTVKITSKLGMRTRSVIKLFGLMQDFDVKVLLCNDGGTEAEANSVIMLLMLGFVRRRQTEIEMTGPQEEETPAVAIVLFNSGFNGD